MSEGGEFGGDGAAIAVPVYGRLDLAMRCIVAIDQTVPPDVALLVIDDCGPDRLTSDSVQSAIRRGRPWRLVQNDANLGFVRTANRAFHVLAGHDVVLINSDVEVLPGWWAALRRAAMGTHVASASALTDEGTILSVPELRGLRGADDLAVSRLVGHAEVRGQVASIPVAVGHCVYLNRSALDDVGIFDEAFSPGYGEEVDWSLRARQRGWRHVAALDSLVLHEGEGSFAAAPAKRRALIRRHEARLALRHPAGFVGIRVFARDRTSTLWLAKRRLAAAAIASVGG